MFWNPLLPMFKDIAFHSRYLTLFRGLSFALMLCLLASSALGKKARVIVSSKASEEYLDAKASGIRSSSESYLMLRGAFVPSSRNDRSLDVIPFEDISELLARELEKKGYQPAGDIESAALLLVVHWGCASAAQSLSERTLASVGTEEPTEDQLGIDPAGGASNPYLDLADPSYDGFSSSGNFRRGRNAELLGINPSQARDADQANLLMEALHEDRYFMAVMAYDIPTLRATGEKKWLWSTRFSVRASGINFEKAQYSLARTAADHFGTNMEEVEIKVTHKGSGSATIGDVELIEVGSQVEE